MVYMLQLCKLRRVTAHPVGGGGGQGAAVRDLVATLATAALGQRSSQMLHFIRRAQ
jgi:hypothetical protein